MFNIGDVVVYSSHGICHIDDICEKTYFGDTKRYYILHPMADEKLSISVPVDNKVSIQELMRKEEAEEIVESFKDQGIAWIDADNERNRTYSEMVKSGERKDASGIANTLMRKKLQLEGSNKKFWENDKKLLASIQNILYAELAYLLDTTSEEISKKVSAYIQESQYPIGS